MATAFIEFVTTPNAGSVTTPSWTPLATDFTTWCPDKPGHQPGGTLATIAATDLQTIPDEIRQIVNVVARGVGSLVGSGEVLDHFQAAILLKIWLSAYLRQGMPQQYAQAG